MAGSGITTVADPLQQLTLGGVVSLVQGTVAGVLDLPEFGSLAITENV